MIVSDGKGKHPGIDRKHLGIDGKHPGIDRKHRGIDGKDPAY